MQSPWTKDKVDFLKENYPDKGKDWCCKQLNMHEHQVRYKASSLGLRINRSSPFFVEVAKKRGKQLAGRKRPDHSVLMKKYAQQGRVLNHPRNKKLFTCSVCGAAFEKPSDKSNMVRCCSSECRNAAQKHVWKNNDHPRGMAGKKHSEETKQKFSEQRFGKKRVLSESARQALSDNASKNMRKRVQEKGTIYSRGKQGWYQIGKSKYYFRSSWEVMYARYLTFLISQGYIQSWEYEVDTFWFESIKRGVRSYNPDFKVKFPDGSIEYHEVKGYMDQKSKTKLKRMKKYYPHIVMVVIGKDEYKHVARYDRLYPEATAL